MRRTAAAYVRALAAMLERARGRPAVLSGRDWDLANRWHERGIPLGLVEEVLRERRARPPRSLAGIATQVEESWVTVERGRSSTSRSGTAGPGAVPGSRKSVREAPRLPPEAEEIVGAIRHAAPDSATRLDLEVRLDEALRRGCGPEILDAITARVDADLRRYRGRMAREMLGRTRDRAVSDALRATFGLHRTPGAR